MRRRVITAVLSAGTALALTAAGLAASPSAAQPAPASAAAATPAATSSRAPAYTPPPIRWGTCQNSLLAENEAQCGFLVVPLDYAKPRGSKIKIAVSRVRHTSKHYQGVMIVNPGGPGGSGLIYAVLGSGDFFPGNADLDYDWVGFDPRGVGSSKPALSCDGDYFGFDRPNYVPTTRALEKAWLKKAANYATDCRYADASRLLPHLKTTDTIKDIESLRKALGQKKINFYGFSYGTYLAQVYATKRPTRVRRFVMDGVINPRRAWYGANIDQDYAFEKSINAWFAWLAKYDAIYHLGNNPDIVRATYFRELDALDAHPAGGVIGPDELSDGILFAAYGTFDWTTFGEAFAALVNRGNYQPIKDLYQGYNPSGPGADNGYAIYAATECTDAPWPKKFSFWRTDNWRVNAKAPFFTWPNAWFNMPCRTWPAKSAKPTKVTGAEVHGSVLLINETYDAATPYSGALKVRQLFPTASLIEGVGGTTHAGSLAGIPCTSNAIAAYLADGTVPARVAGNRSDRQCPPVPQPVPVSSATSQRSATSVVARVQRELRRVGRF